MPSLKDIFQLPRNLQEHMFNLLSKTNKYEMIKYQQNIKLLETVHRFNQSEGGIKDLKGEEQKQTLT